MKNSTLLTQLAMAGIASGMIAVTACNKSEKTGEASGSSSEAKIAPSETPAPEIAAAPDSAMADTIKVDSTAGAKHACKGINACKGQGGCAVTESDLKVYAAKAGVPIEKAGKPHSCKGLNECKGLGGCKM